MHTSWELSLSTGKYIVVYTHN